MIKKRYKLLNLENKRIFVSRDVHFFEHIFPFVDKSDDIPSSIFPDYAIYLLISLILKLISFLIPFHLLVPLLHQIIHSLHHHLIQLILRFPLGSTHSHISYLDSSINNPRRSHRIKKLYRHIFKIIIATPFFQ